MGVSSDVIKLLTIPFELNEEANSWLESLSPNSITTWREFLQLFLQCMLSMPKVMSIYTQLFHFRQNTTRTLGQAWERFKTILQSILGGGIHFAIQIQHFYNGLNSKNR